MSMIKRTMGSFAAARSDLARPKEAKLKVLTHNIMLIVAALIWLFYSASDAPFYVPKLCSHLVVQRSALPLTI